MRMDPLRRRGGRQVRQEVSRSYTLPFSCIEIPDPILPPSSAASGFIIADNSCSKVTPGGPACECRYTAETPAAPLRVLLLPPASLLPHDSPPDKPLDLVRRLLLLQPDKGRRVAAGTASVETADIYLRTSVLRLARQARLALDLLAGSYRIAGVWLRTDLGEDILEDYVIHQPYQYSFIKSLANAIAKANAASLHVLLNTEKAAEVCCCFLFLSRSTVASAVDGGGDTRNILGYQCSGSSVTTLGFHRLPVIVRQAGHLQHASPLTRNILYSTCIPVQVELSCTPSEVFNLSVQASRQQLCAALASELYVNFTAVLSPPLLASAVVSKPSAVTQWIPLARQGYAAASFTLKKKVGCQYMNQKGHTHCTCTIPKKVTEELLCNPAANSTSPTHSGNASSISSRHQHRHYQVHAHSCVNTGESPMLCSSVVLSSPSKSVWDECCGEKNFAQASYCLPLCFLQPLLVGDLVSRYRIFPDISLEPSEGRQQGVEFRVHPCDVSCDTDPSSLAREKPETFSTELSRLCCPLVLCVKSEFVAAVVAPVNASLDYLRKSLAADAAPAVARRVVDCLADACAAYTHQKKPQKQKPWKNPGNEQQPLSQTLASLEVRRLYTVRLVRALQKRKKQYDGVVTTLLLSDFSNPAETEDVAAQAAVERFDVILGIPPSAVVPHSYLKDGCVTVAVCVNSARNVALVDHEREHQRQQPLSATNVRKRNSVLGTQTSQAAAFCNILESRSRRKKITRPGACGGKICAYGQKNLSRILLSGCLVLLAILLVARLLFPSTTRTNQFGTS